MGRSESESGRKMSGGRSGSGIEGARGGGKGGGKGAGWTVSGR